MFAKVLIANRGEIAVRIIHALREMGIASVAVYSEADRRALHVQMADEAICIGAAPSSESYLRSEKIIAAARQTNAEAIHPGYGFLSENAAFARLCEESGINFIGPGWRAIEQMGSKTAARRVALAAGAPVVPGTEDAVEDPAQARRIAAAIGYPVLLKASAGGGGKGMRRVDSEDELASAMRAASGEAQSSFGSGEVYLEKLIERPRHIEVQILGDEYGHLIHLGERECSIQRRHQKIIEECPSPLVASRPELREEIGRAALSIAKAVSYCSAGTLEFLADQGGRFYFLEMNTRLQVEHPVTEWVTGIDLVQWQLRIASGEPLTVLQEEVRWTGSAIECRIYAEDPAQNFFPSPGSLTQFVAPSGPGVRLDNGVYSGWNVPVDYDPLLAKLSVWSQTRSSAIDRMQRALNECRVLGVATNLQLFERLMADANWRAGDLDTGFLDRFMRQPPESGPDTEDLVASVLAAAVMSLHSPLGQASPPAAPPSRWQARGRQALLR